MKDSAYFELRNLTELIFLVRQTLKDMNYLDKDYDEIIKYYNELCKKREEIEDKYFK